MIGALSLKKEKMLVFLCCCIKGQDNLAVKEFTGTLKPINTHKTIKERNIFEREKHF